MLAFVASKSPPKWYIYQRTHLKISYLFQLNTKFNSTYTPKYSLLKATMLCSETLFFKVCDLFGKTRSLTLFFWKKIHSKMLYSMSSYLIIQMRLFFGIFANRVGASYHLLFYPRRLISFQARQKNAHCIISEAGLNIMTILSEERSEPIPSWTGHKFFINQGLIPHMD